MAAPYNDLLSKLEAAEKSVIDALALTGTRAGDAVDLTVNTGLDDSDLLRPCAICQAEDTTEEAVRDSGNFRVKTRIRIQSHSTDEDLAIHRARVGAIADAFHRDDIAATLTAALADFHVFDVEFLGLTADPEGDSFQTDIELTVVCCGMDLS